MDIICVVLGADTKNFRTQDSVKLINYIFDNSRMAKCAGRSWESSRKRKKSKQ